MIKIFLKRGRQEAHRALQRSRFFGALRGQGHLSSPLHPKLSYTMKNIKAKIQNEEGKQDF